MKTKILLLALILFSNFMFGQVKITKEQEDGIKKSVLDSIKKKLKPVDLVTLEAIYDFRNGAYISKKLKPKHNQPVVLKIRNINKIAYRYDIIINDGKIDNNLDAMQKKVEDIVDKSKLTDEVKINQVSTDVSMSKKTQQILDVNAQPTKDTKKATDDLNKKISELNRNVIDKGKIISEHSKTIKKHNENIINNIKLILKNDSILKTETDKTQKDNIIENTKKLNTNNDLINEQKVALDKEIEDVQKEIDSLNNEIDLYQKNLDKFGNISDLLNKRTAELFKSYNNFNENLVQINRINASYNSFIKFIINPSLTKDEYDKNAVEICSVLKEEKGKKYIYSYYKIITNFDKNFTDFNKQYNELINDDLFYQISSMGEESYSDLVKLKLNNIKAEVEKVYSLVNISQLREKLNNIEIIDLYMSNPSAYEIISNPVQPVEDYISIKAVIDQSNLDFGTSIIKQPKIEIPFMEYLSGGVRWDFSVGTVFDFGIKNQEYELEKISDTIYNIKENNSSEYTPTIAGLLHTSIRSNNMFAFGFTLGMSIDLTNLNLNSFFPGVSLLIGKREKLVFTIGPALKRVNQLKSIYNINTPLKSSVAVEELTNQQFKTGWFFAMSWNLTNKQIAKIKP